MNNRRSFLKMLGLSAIVVPASAVANNAVRQDILLASRNAEHAERYAAALAAQRRHTALIEMDGYGERLWLDWAKKATARG